MQAVLSIQSAVAYGQVGNSAAVLPLQRLGFEVWPVNTVQLAHHPGYGKFVGHLVEPERIAAILEGLVERAPLADCAGLLSGYLGTAEAAPLVFDILREIRERRPDLVYLCDPVIGDDGAGVFVRPGVAEAIREALLPAATIVTPNRFELALLAGRSVATAEEALAAARTLQGLGPEIVVATGLPLGDRLGLLAVSAAEAWLLTTPRLPRPFAGTGDAFGGLLLGHYLKARDLKTALERAATAIFGLAELTLAEGSTELSLVAAQDLFALTEARFVAEPMAHPAESAR
jgi:pyridoxine kinase